MKLVKEGTQRERRSNNMWFDIPVKGSRSTVKFEDVSDVNYRLTINSNSGRFVEVDEDGNSVVSVIITKADVKRLAKAS
jgi:hypothetical protein